GGAALAAGIVGCVSAPPTWPLPSGLGGVVGDVALAIPSWFAGGYPTGAAAILTIAIYAVPTLWLLAFGAAIIRRPVDEDAPAASRKPARRRRAQEVEEEEDDLEDDEDERGGLLAAFGAVTHWWLSTRAFVRRHTSGMPRPRVLHRYDDEDDMPEMPAVARRGDRIEPGFDNAPRLDDIEPPFDAGSADDYQAYDDDFDDDVVIRPTPQAS